MAAITTLLREKKCRESAKIREERKRAGLQRTSTLLPCAATAGATMSDGS